MSKELEGFLSHSDRLNLIVGRNPNQVIRGKLMCGFKRGVEESVRRALSYVGVTCKDQDYVITEGRWK
jgi:hypothetical protein